MKIDTKTYAVKDINRHKSQTVKTQIVIATSMRKNGNHISRLEHKDFGKTKKWNTFTITREGVVYQHFDSKYHSDFLGIKEGDKQSISIVLENMGYLFKAPNGSYINWLNESCSEDRIVEKDWLGYNLWEKFDDEQIGSLVILCRELCEKHSIPKVCIDFHHYHKDIARFRGILFRSNYIENSSDINPLFEIEKFNEMLHNEFI